MDPPTLPHLNVFPPLVEAIGVVVAAVAVGFSSASTSSGVITLVCPPPTIEDS